MESKIGSEITRFVAQRLRKALPNISVNYLSDEEMNRIFGSSPSLINEGEVGLRPILPPTPLKNKITDFGEKIGGAKKDYFRNYIESTTHFSDIEKLSSSAQLSKSKLLPELNYSKIIQLYPDCQKELLAFSKMLYVQFGVLAKQSKDYKKLVEQALCIRNINIEILSSIENNIPTDINIFRKDLSNIDFSHRFEKTYVSESSSEFNENMNLFFLPKVLVEAKFWENYIDYQKVFPCIYVSKFTNPDDGSLKKYIATFIYGYDFVLTEEKTEEQLEKEIIEFLTSKLCSISTELKQERQSSSKATTKEAPVYVYYYKSSGEYFIGFPRRKKIKIIERGFTSSKDAHSALSNNREHYEKMYYEFIKPVKEREGLSNEERTGKELLASDENITPEKYTEVFGFKGVEFGNWLNQKDRQQFLNQSYVAFLDLASAIGVPPKALSLNGTLSMAFGSRGNGGKKSACAHYEPLKKVINLTKLGGAGSLAHEWFHALDNYLSGVVNRPFDYSTMLSYDSVKGERAVLYNYLSHFESRLKTHTDLINRSSEADLYQSNRKPYFRTIVEMSARGFEFYVKSKLEEQGIKNDFLVNFIPPPPNNTELINKFPYPLPSEKEDIVYIYDELFSKIEYKTVGNNIMLYHAQGNKILGHTNGTDEIFLNKDYPSINTHIHEYAHIWLNSMKMINPDLYNRGIELIKENGEEYLNDIKSNPIYSDLSEEQIYEEALVLAIGNEGEKFVKSNSSSYFKFRQFLDDFKTFVQDTFFFKQKDKLKEMSFSDFLKGSVYDLLQGEDLQLDKELEITNKEEIAIPTPIIEEVSSLEKEEKPSEIKFIYSIVDKETGTAKEEESYNEITTELIHIPNVITDIYNKLDDESIAIINLSPSHKIVMGNTESELIDAISEFGINPNTIDIENIKSNSNNMSTENLEPEKLKVLFKTKRLPNGKTEFTAEQSTRNEDIMKSHDPRIDLIDWNEINRRDEEWKKEVLENENWKEIEGGFYWEHPSGIANFNVKEDELKKYNHFELGWYDNSGNLLSDDLNLFKNNAGHLELDNITYSWDLAKNLSESEFKAVMTDLSEYDVTEILQEMGKSQELIDFVKDNFSDITDKNFPQSQELIQSIYESNDFKDLKTLNEDILSKLPNYQNLETTTETQVSKQEQQENNKPQPKMNNTSSLNDFYKNWVIQPKSKLSFNDIYAFITQTSKNQLIDILKQQAPDISIPSKWNKESVLNNIVNPINSSEPSNVEAFKTILDETAKTSIKEKNIPENSPEQEQKDWDNYYHQIREKTKDKDYFETPINHTDVYAFLKANHIPSIEKLAFLKKIDNNLHLQTFSGDYLKKEVVLKNLVYPILEQKKSKEFKESLKELYDNFPVKKEELHIKEGNFYGKEEGKETTTLVNKYSEEEFEKFYEKFSLNYDPTTDITPTVIYAYINDKGISAQAKMNTLNDLNQKVGHNSLFINKETELYRVTKDRIVSGLLNPLREDKTSLEEEFKFNLKVAFVNSRENRRNYSNILDGLEVNIDNIKKVNIDTLNKILSDSDFNLKDLADKLNIEGISDKNSPEDKVVFMQTVNHSPTHLDNLKEIIKNEEKQSQTKKNTHQYKR